MNNDKANQINECNNNISYYQNRIEMQEKDRAIIQNKINRLIPVRDSVATYKSKIKSDWIKEVSQGHNYDQLSDWKGNTHDSFMDNYHAGLLFDYKSYYAQIDAIHDGLNSEIARLQNKLYEMDGMLGWLRARLNEFYC